MTVTLIGLVSPVKSFTKLEFKKGAPILSWISRVCLNSHSRQALLHVAETVKAIGRKP
jgi:hypothetical protein